MPAFTFSFLHFLFIYTTYNKALNVKLIKLRFTFAFFNLVNITSTVLVLIGSMYLISIDDGLCIYINRIMLLIEEFDDTFSSFIGTMDKHCSVAPKT